MRCIRCGAKIGRRDEFCRKCGASVDRTERKEFRDSFYEDREEGGHALLITILIFLLIAVSILVIVLAGVLRAKYRERKKAQGSGYETLSEQVSEAEMTEDNETGPILVIEGEGHSADTPGDEAQEQPDTAVTEKEKTEETESEEDKTEQKTEAATETEKHGAPDMVRVTQELYSAPDLMRGAVFIYDLDENEEYPGEGSEEAMYASATITVPILYAAAYLLDEAEITLDERIVYVNSIGGRGEASPEQREGQEFPLSYYLMTMLSYSDNNCMNTLMDYIGRDRINLICHNAGFTSVDLQRSIVEEVTDGTENYVSPRDLVMMVKELYNGRFTFIGREFMEQYFRVDEFDPIVTVLGNAPSIENAALFLNQDGKTDTRYSEVAVVEKDSHRFVIGIMVNGEQGMYPDQAVMNAVDAAMEGIAGN